MYCREREKNEVRREGERMRGGREGGRRREREREREREMSLLLILLAVLCIVLVAGLWLAVAETLPSSKSQSPCSGNGMSPAIFAEAALYCVNVCLCV